MFLNHLSIGFLIFLVYAEHVIGDQLAWKAQDFNQPLIITKEIIEYLTDIDISYSASVPVSHDEQLIHYDSKQNTLISACPSDKPKGNMILVVNDEIKTSCTTDFIPTVSEHRIGDAYSVGYLFSSSGNQDISVTSVFLNIFHVHYSEQRGLLFTSHVIHPGPKITLAEWENEKKLEQFESKFLPNQLYLNEVQIQLVPFEDLIPIPWKITTLIDVNFIYAPHNVKEGLDKLNDFLRNYVNKERTSLKIYSGVMEKSWYWKVVRQGEKGLLIFVADPFSDQHTDICQNQCEEFGLSTLNEKIPELRCCPLTEAIATLLKILVIENNKPLDYMYFAETLNFNHELKGESTISDR